MFLARRMNVIDNESHPMRLSPRYPLFLFYLVKEVIKANIDVAKRILTPGASISPQLIKVPTKQKNDLARVVYANSITLTPGTVSVDLGTDQITVHSLSRETAQDLKTGNMAKAVQTSVSES